MYLFMISYVLVVFWMFILQLFGIFSYILIVFAHFDMNFYILIVSTCVMCHLLFMAYLYFCDFDIGV
jgi:hypothetical protein